jgi:hypothetical protein
MSHHENDPRHVRLAAKLLARRASEREAGTPAALPDRPSSIDAIARALRARGRRRLAPWLGWGAAAAAAVLLSFGWRGLRSTEPARTASAAHGTRPAEMKLAIADVEGAGAAIETPLGVRPAARGDRIAAGTFVRVPGPGQIVLALDTGTRLRVGAASGVRLTALGPIQRFDVESGTLEANVAKVAPGGRFIVATGDAEVEVRGTRFEVTVVPTPSSCAPFARTQVVVHEGAVVVRFGGGEVRLPAGAAWPDCPLPAPAAQSARTRAPRPAAGAAPTTASMPATADPSTLAEQNDLFAAALAAQRRGDADEAIHWFDRLMARYPQGPLNNSARAERQRLLDSRRERAPSE